jgi:hypothetical protein
MDTSSLAGVDLLSEQQEILAHSAVGADGFPSSQDQHPFDTWSEVGNPLDLLLMPLMHGEANPIPDPTIYPGMHPTEMHQAGSAAHVSAEKAKSMPVYVKLQPPATPAAPAADEDEYIPPPPPLKEKRSAAKKRKQQEQQKQQQHKKTGKSVKSEQQQEEEAEEEKEEKVGGNADATGKCPRSLWTNCMTQPEREAYLRGKTDNLLATLSSVLHHNGAWSYLFIGCSPNGTFYLDGDVAHGRRLLEDPYIARAALTKMIPMPESVRDRRLESKEMRGDFNITTDTWNRAARVEHMDLQGAGVTETVFPGKVAKLESDVKPWHEKDCDCVKKMKAPKRAGMLKRCACDYINGPTDHAYALVKPSVPADHIRRINEIPTAVPEEWKPFNKGYCTPAKVTTAAAAASSGFAKNSRFMTGEQRAEILNMFAMQKQCRGARAVAFKVDLTAIALMAFSF